MEEKQIIKNLEEKGFKDCQVVEFTDEDKEFGEDHTHDVTTIHHILEGELIILEKNNLMSYKEGDIVEFPSGTTHAAKAGENGCKMIVGFKEN